MLKAVLQTRGKWCQMVTSQEGMKGTKNDKYVGGYIDVHFPQIALKDL